VQAADDADAVESRFGRQPLIYYTNGYEHWFWDDQAYPPRRVEGSTPATNWRRWSAAAPERVRFAPNP